MATAKTAVDRPLDIFERVILVSFDLSDFCCLVPVNDERQRHEMPLSRLA
jgi:hypothetical protein